MLALQFCLPFNKPLAACARSKLPELKNAPAGRSSPGDAALAARAHRDHGRVCRGHSDTTRFPPSPLASAVPGPPSGGTDLRHAGHTGTTLTCAVTQVSQPLSATPRL